MARLRNRFIHRIGWSAVICLVAIDRVRKIQAGGFSRNRLDALARHEDGEEKEHQADPVELPLEAGHPDRDRVGEKERDDPPGIDPPPPREAPEHHGRNQVHRNDERPHQQSERNPGVPRCAIDHADHPRRHLRGHAHRPSCSTR